MKIIALILVAATLASCARPPPTFHMELNDVETDGLNMIVRAEEFGTHCVTSIPEPKYASLRDSSVELNAAIKYAIEWSRMNGTHVVLEMPHGTCRLDHSLHVEPSIAQWIVFYGGTYLVQSNVPAVQVDSPSLEPTVYSMEAPIKVHRPNTRGTCNPGHRICDEEAMKEDAAEAAAKSARSDERGVGAPFIIHDDGGHTWASCGAGYNANGWQSGNWPVTCSGTYPSYDFNPYDLMCPPQRTCHTPAVPDPDHPGYAIPMPTASDNRFAP